MKEFAHKKKYRSGLFAKTAAIFLFSIVMSVALFLG